MALLTILIIFTLLEVSYLIFRQSGARLHSGSERPVFIDTSALMDGRIVVAAQTGFIPGKLVVPTSVVSELQLLADQADAEKRSRARRGLDAIQELQAIEGISVSILDDGPTGDGGVDSRLVELAQKQKGSVCTIDFNLNKVATVKGIRVLNINELAGSIRMAFLPGETVSLQLNQKGQGKDQAVGYLADGTMVVVDKAAGHIGQTIEVEFIRSLQTAAGRMMFAKSLVKPAVSQSDLAKNGSSSVSESKPRTRRRIKEDTISGSAPTPSRNKTTQRQNRQRQSKEDSLIQLVNEQQR